MLHYRLNAVRHRRAACKEMAHVSQEQSLKLRALPHVRQHAVDVPCLIRIHRLQRGVDAFRDQVFHNRVSMSALISWYRAAPEGDFEVLAGYSNAGLGVVWTSRQNSAARPTVPANSELFTTRCLQKVGRMVRRPTAP